MGSEPRLMHFSSKPLGPIYSVKQSTTEHWKPRGLWVSVEGNGDGWRTWCEDEQFGIGELAYDVTLAPNANILRIQSVDQLDAASHEYKVEGGRFTYALNWPLVATSYQGLIITPYLWERRLTEHTNWYYTWDCASGCIWDAEAVASVEAARLPFPQLRAVEEAAE